MENPLAAFFPLLAWATLIGATLLCIALGAILAYHWFKYAMNPPMASTALIVYSVGCGFLLSGLLAATIAVQFAS